MKIAIIFLFLMGSVGSFVFSQSSHDKESIINARKRDAAKKERAKKPAKLSFEANGYSSDAEYYPTETMTWGKGFSDGLAKITVDGKAGFIDPRGNVVIEPRLKDAGQFSGGLAPFEANNGKWGFLDTAGATKIKPQFDWAFSFCEDRALVQIGQFWGYVDKTGAIVIPAIYEDADSFSEGLASISFYDGSPVPALPNGRWQYRFIDKEGKIAISKTFDGVARGFDEGMALVSRDIGYNKGVVAESYFIDKTGKELWVLDSGFVSWFSDDAIVIATGKDENGHDLYSYLDRDGKRLTDRTFSYLSGFFEGLSVARVGWTDDMGFIDRSGKFVIQPKFDWVNPFSEGLAGAKMQYEKWGFIDKSGKWVIEPQFDWVGEFQEGAALVAAGEKGGNSQKMGYIDRAGKYIWKPTK